MTEDKLLFIVCQPRSGSTLTQKLLSNNPMVDTVSEPWLLLPLLSMYRPELVNAKYNYQVASQAFFDYLKKKDLSEDVRHAIKEVILALDWVRGESKYIIDTTPRNYETL